MSLTIKLLPVIEEPAAEPHQKQSAGEVQPRKKSCLLFPSARAVYLAATIERIRFDAEGWRGDKYPRWRHGHVPLVDDEK